MVYYTCIIFIYYTIDKVVMNQMKASEKLKFLIKRMKRMDYSKMMNTARALHKKTGKPTLWLLADMAGCAVKYSAGYSDYKIAEMYNLNSAQRKTQITRGLSNQIVRKMNPKEYWHYFDDKAEFNKVFAKYIKREWYSLKDGSREGFYSWLEGKSDLIAKPIDGTCGIGVKKYTKAQYEAIPDFYQELISRNIGIVEEYVIQHEALSRINPTSVNTMRIVTLNGDKKYGIVYAALRIGNAGMNVDNVDSGGMACPIDLETGVLGASGADKAGNIYVTHPVTGVTLKGYQLPYFEEAKAMCMEASEVVPQIRYIAWDVAITPSGPIFIEGNSYPSHAVPQFASHYPDGIGIMTEFRKFMTI
jgi:glutathione synthase/RimK-type ligase-like ATP-grasp enzyme